MLSAMLEGKLSSNDPWVVKSLWRISRPVVNADGLKFSHVVSRVCRDPNTADSEVVLYPADHSGKELSDIPVLSLPKCDVAQRAIFKLVAKYQNQ